MYEVLEQIILDRVIAKKQHATSKLAFVLTDMRLTKCSSLGERWKFGRYSKPMQLAFLEFEAAFDFPHRGCLLNALHVDGVPGKVVRLIDNMN
ncbi:hypothetical protein RB195_010269 [Necator americanus]|uniref:Uncharacterized protein n=1 Tax=Necator americanus TaxID=51031 RepID=A0ABR1CX59_NECAM